MIGYCSNSPLRCENARSAKVLNQVDSCCPQCNVSLIPVQDVSQQIIADEKFLRFAILAVALVVLVFIYIYYADVA